MRYKKRQCMLERRMWSPNNFLASEYSDLDIQLLQTQCSSVRLMSASHITLLRAKLLLLYFNLILPT
jgi:hypothetical protein